MRRIRKLAQRAAQWVIDSVVGTGLAQSSSEARGDAEVTDTMRALARSAAAQGCVLLANDGTLPLEREAEVAVFGRCQCDWFSMGHGSGGEVHPAYSTNLLDGLDDAGVCYNRVLAQTYREWCASEEHAADPGWWGHWPTCHPEMPVSEKLAQAAARTADVALVVVGRATGEDLDLPLAPGGYYLSDDEHGLLDTVTDAFAHTVVVLNVGNAIDLSWLDSYGTRIGAILCAWQGGMEAGNAVADVLCGDENPSGRLACTFARSYDDYPSSKSFGSADEVAYDEGVFMGYRHFDARAPEAVLYRFGHGLSYTTFEIQGTLRVTDACVTVEVDVTNTGSRAGREVVQLWCTPPAGSIAKPVRMLAAFGKTDEIAPGASERLVLTCDAKTISSFDESDQAFVLEPGTYCFVTNDVAVGSWEVDDTIVVERCDTICLPSEQLRARILERLPKEIPPTGDKGISLADVADGSATLEAFVAQLSDRELEALSRGEGTMNSALGVPGNAGAFGGVTDALRKRGIPAIICADGPSGARLQRRGSMVACATALACTWNTELVEQLFYALGEEAREAGVDVLLAPGMNLQRDSRCGRNFEYFSEDPLIAGRMAGAVVRGLQGAGVSACPKHLACNNQEFKRNTSDSRVSERALRELYLRGFELCVREARPDLIMTSYNKINGVWAHYHYGLATTVLRDEWGFEGVVVTDWWMRPSRSPEFPELRDNAYRIRAGVDVLMPGSMSRVRNVRARARYLTRAELQRTTIRVLTFALSRLH